MQLKVENAFVEAGLFVGDTHRLRKWDEVGGRDANPKPKQSAQLCLKLHDSANAEQVRPIGGADDAAFGNILRVVIIGNHLFDVVIRHIATHTDVKVLSQRMGVQSRYTRLYLVDSLRDTRVIHLPTMPHVIDIDLEVEVRMPPVDDEGSAASHRLVEKGVGGEVLVETGFNALGSRRQTHQYRQSQKNRLFHCRYHFFQPNGR